MFHHIWKGGKFGNKQIERLDIFTLLFQQLVSVSFSVFALNVRNADIQNPLRGTFTLFKTMGFSHPLEQATVGEELREGCGERRELY